jgi:hypothetical protein
MTVATDDLGRLPEPSRHRRGTGRSWTAPESRLAAGAILTALIGTLLTACGSGTPAADPSTPTVAVTDYYRALEHHQLTQAASYVASAAQGSITSENANFLAITHLRVAPAKPMSLSLISPQAVPAADYSSFAQVVAYFDATLHQVIDTPNGPQAQFLYLGKNRNKEIGWQILSIGSGP